LPEFENKFEALKSKYEERIPGIKHLKVSARVTNIPFDQTVADLVQTQKNGGYLPVDLEVFEQRAATVKLVVPPKPTGPSQNAQNMQFNRPVNNIESNSSIESSEIEPERTPYRVRLELNNFLVLKAMFLDFDSSVRQWFIDDMQKVMNDRRIRLLVTEDFPKALIVFTKSPPVKQTVNEWTQRFFYFLTRFEAKFQAREIEEKKYDDEQVLGKILFLGENGEYVAIGYDESKRTFTITATDETFQKLVTFQAISPEFRQYLICGDDCLNQQPADIPLNSEQVKYNFANWISERFFFLNNTTLPHKMSYLKYCAYKQFTSIVKNYNYPFAGQESGTTLVFKQNVKSEVRARLLNDIQTELLQLKKESFETEYLPGLFNVLVENQNGCRLSDEFELNVSKIESRPLFFFSF
jgi:hypothetical protein